MTSTSPGDDRTQFDALSPDAMLRVNQTCDAFEEQWGQEGEVDIGEFLQQLESDQIVNGDFEANVLIMELVSLDIRYRLKFALPVPIDKYCQFPKIDRQSILDLVDSARREIDSNVGNLEPKQQLGDYIILRSIGHGGMGQLYQAEHALMGRKVAIKILPNKLQHDSIAQRRFAREVRSISKLAHPNILTAFDARRERGMLYLVTEWIDGDDLSKLVAANGPLGITDAIDFVWQSAEGLQYAHQQGVIHRDVKPSNLLLDASGRIKVLDLGLAKVSRNISTEETLTEDLTKSSEILGTAAFLSPEQARNPLSADARSDIYSLGCTLFYLLSGKPPYCGTSRMDMVVGHLSSPIPELDDTIPEAPAKLHHLLRSMLAKSPDDRPSSMAAIGSKLREIQSELSARPVISKYPLEAVQQLARSLPRVTRRGRRAMLGCGIAAICLSLVEVGRRTWDQFAGGRGESDALASGVLMNGRTSYGEVEGFATQLSGPTMFEAWVTPQVGDLPSNVISWTGRDALVLFISAQAEWGVALLHNGHYRLVASVDKVVLNRNYLVAAIWEEPNLRLFINGQEVQTRGIRYDFRPNRTSLCFGGIPDDLFPPEHGTRFFSGLIKVIRISIGDRLRPAITPSELVFDDDSTFALFPFDEGQGSVVRDISQHGWQAELVDTEWYDSRSND